MFSFWRNGKQIPIIAIAMVYSKCMLIFIRNWQAIFHNGWPFYSSLQCMRLSAAPHPHLHLIFTVFLNFYIQVCVKWYLMVLLICISLMNNNVEIFSYSISHIYFGVCAVFVQVFFLPYWIVFLIIRNIHSYISYFMYIKSFLIKCLHSYRVIIFLYILITNS